MNQLLRRSGLVLALVVGLAMAGLLRADTTTAGAPRVDPPATHTATTLTPRQAVASHDTLATSDESRTARHRKPPLSSIGPSYMASSWCGNFWRGPMYCINFTRSEQKWLSGLSLTAATAAICGATGIGCVVAATIAYGLQRYVDNHGICPSGDPILEIEYAPHPGGYLACSDG
jgi:hypothetical protein